MSFSHLGVLCINLYCKFECSQINNKRYKTIFLKIENPYFCAPHPNNPKNQFANFTNMVDPSTKFHTNRNKERFKSYRVTNGQTIYKLKFDLTNFVEKIFLAGIHQNYGEIYILFCPYSSRHLLAQVVPVAVVAIETDPHHGDHPQGLHLGVLELILVCSSTSMYNRQKNGKN